jgi:hypothetical protein
MDRPRPRHPAEEISMVAALGIRDERGTGKLLPDLPYDATL